MTTGRTGICEPMAAAKAPFLKGSISLALVLWWRVPSGKMITWVFFSLACSKVMVNYWINFRNGSSDIFLDFKTYKKIPALDVHKMTIFYMQGPLKRLLLQVTWSHKLASGEFMEPKKSLFMRLCGKTCTNTNNVTNCIFIALALMIVSSRILLDSAPRLLSMNVVPLRYADSPNGPKYMRAFLASVVALSISGLRMMS